MPAILIQHVKFSLNVSHGNRLNVVFIHYVCRVGPLSHSAGILINPVFPTSGKAFEFYVFLTQLTTYQ